jgi:hypothetical protein
MRRTGQKRRRTGQRGGNPAELTTEDTESTEEIASRYKYLPPLFADSNLLPNLIFYSVLSVSSVVK